jgi:hypothetical protein
MAGAATLQPHWSMLERKGTGLIAMAPCAARFVGARGLGHFGQHTAVRIVAIHARHGAFGQAVFVGALKAGPNVGVASGALRVDFRRLARHKPVRSILVDGVAGSATYVILVMTAGQTAGVSGLVLMAGETDTVGLGGL